MKKIGLIGGLSYQSTLHYYQGINDGVNARLGGLASAEILLHSVNFAEYKKWMDDGDWDAIAYELQYITAKLCDAGADCIAIASNTMHKVACQIEHSSFRVPLMHISDAVAKRCLEKGIKSVGLLGTRLTMEEDFITKRLIKNGVYATTPASDEQLEEINRIIFEELCKGCIKDSSKKYIIDQMEGAVNAGAKGIVLGCTELQMLFEPNSKFVGLNSGEYDLSETPIFDTTQAHIDALVDFCLSDEQEVCIGSARHQGFF